MLILVVSEFECPEDFLCVCNLVCLFVWSGILLNFIYFSFFFVFIKLVIVISITSSLFCILFWQRHVMLINVLVLFCAFLSITPTTTKRPFIEKVALELINGSCSLLFLFWWNHWEIEEKTLLLLRCCYSSFFLYDLVLCCNQLKQQRKGIFLQNRLSKWNSLQVLYAM